MKYCGCSGKLFVRKTRDVVCGAVRCDVGGSEVNQVGADLGVIENIICLLLY